MSNLQRGTLPPDTIRHLRQVAQSSDAAMSRRAQIVLNYHEGRSLSEIAREFDLTISGAKYWVKQFEDKGLSIFREADVVDPITEPVIEAEPPKAKRGRPPKATAPIVEPEQPKAKRGRPPKAAPEPVIEVEPPKVKRGRPPKAVLPPEPEIRPSEPEPEIVPPPTPEPEIRPSEPEPEIAPPPTPEPEIVPPEPPKAKRGRKPKATPAIEQAIVVAEPVEVVELEQAEPETVVLEPITSVTGLVNRYNVNLEHARYVTQQAFTLFDATAELHHLPDRSRGLLEAGALLHNVAYEIDPDEHHKRGRDIILETPLKGFSDDERRMIALLAAFHRKKVHPEREPAFIELPTELRRDVLSLAAILRLADGSDNSLTQTTTINDVQIAPDELVIRLGGENAEMNAERMRKKSDLWEKQFDQRVRVEIVGNNETAISVSVPHVLTAPPILREHMPDLVLTLDPAMSGIRALRKLAMHYTDRLERLAAQVRAGDGRRLPGLEREIDRLEGLLALARTEDFSDELRWLADRTRTAMIAFTLHDRAASLADDPDDPNAPIIAGRLGAWYQQARTALEQIDFERYNALMDGLRRELVSETADENATGGALINTLVGPTVWGQLTELRDVMERGESVTDALRAARRLQDYLLYFRSLLGAEAIQALDMLTPFESYLSAIHLVQSILGLIEQPHNHQDNGAAEIVRNAQMETLNTLADGLPGVWASVNSQIFRRALALALATP